MTSTQRSSRAVISQFLLIGALVAVGCKRPADAPSKPNQLPSGFAFQDIAGRCGIDFQHRAGGAEQFFFPAIMSAGCAFLDHDQDGDLDVLLIDSGEVSRSDVSNPASGAPSCRLFEQHAPLKFLDITDRSGLSHHEYGVGVAVGDINNDGRPDLYFTNYGPDRLYLNQGDGKFADVTKTAGIDNLRWGVSAAFFDYDRDGWLDLFVVNYVDYDPAQPCRVNSGQQDFCNPAVFRGSPAKLYRNATRKSSATVGETDKIAFEDVSLTSGVALKSAAGLGVTCADFNNDDWPDVFVANDGNPNFLWINQRDGTFRDDGVLAGVAYDNLGRTQGSMGIGIADVDDNQTLDLLVTNLDGEYNALYLGEGDGTFRDGSVAGGLLGPSFPYTGFGAALADLEHDGDPDLVVVNGRVRRLASATESPSTGQASDFWSHYVESNQLMTNNGRGEFTSEPSGSGNAFLEVKAVSRGLAMGDVDNDGDLDMLVGVTAGKAQLFQNQTPSRGHWLQVKAVDGRFGGRDMIGTKITVHAANRKWIGVVNPGSSYTSSHDPRVHFGLGDIAEYQRLEVVWPDGVKETFLGGAVGQLVQLEYGKGEKP